MKISLTGRGGIDQELGVHDLWQLKGGIFGKKKTKAKYPEDDGFPDNKRDIFSGRAVLRLGKLGTGPKLLGMVHQIDSQEMGGKNTRKRAGEAAAVAQGASKVEERRWDAGRVGQSIPSYLQNLFAPDPDPNMGS